MPSPSPHCPSLSPSSDCVFAPAHARSPASSSYLPPSSSQSAPPASCSSATPRSSSQPPGPSVHSASPASASAFPAFPRLLRHSNSKFHSSRCIPDRSPSDSPASPAAAARTRTDHNNSVCLLPQPASSEALAASGERWRVGSSAWRCLEGQLAVPAFLPHSFLYPFSVAFDPFVLLLP